MFKYSNVFVNIAGEDIWSTRIHLLEYVYYKDIKEIHHIRTGDMT